MHRLGAGWLMTDASPTSVPTRLTQATARSCSAPAPMAENGLFILVAVDFAVEAGRSRIRFLLLGPFAYPAPTAAAPGR